jgi:hypothetical protein
MTLHVYQVGFGDCFLMSWHYAGGRDRNILIDFGSTGLPPGVPKEQLKLIAHDIESVCGENGLAALVVTHRHRDHVSGFATNTAGTASGDIIRKLAPSVVVEPWTEDPRAKRNATRAVSTLDKNLALVRSLQEQRLAAVNVAAEADAMLTAIGSGPGRGRFLTAKVEGMEGILNPSAVKNLETMSKRHAYVNHGSKSGLESVLPGVSVTVLGPPTLDQSDEIRKERANDEAEFWMLQKQAVASLRSTPAASAESALFPNAKVVTSNPTYAARWLSQRLRNIRGSELLGIVRILDKQMNNTSVILLFEVAGQKFLFPGDAQIENWEFTLAQSALMSRLRGVTFYKVGHHGSRNATPKTLWDGFRMKSSTDSQKRLRTVVSTMAGKFKGTAGKHTEVPRQTLMTALRQNTTFFSTQQLVGAENTLKQTFPFSFGRR